MKSDAKRSPVVTLTLGAILTALVVILQYAGSFVRFGTFQVSLVLIPIVIGAALCGKYIGAWLGFVFGLVVLLNGDAAVFLAINIPGTIITVLLKGTLCGFIAGLVYELIAKKNQDIGAISAAIICPIINTGVFLLGCLVFFLPTIKEWAAPKYGENFMLYMIAGLVGLNFLVELAFNLVLSPVIVRLIKLTAKIK